jgi:RNA polymerase sigma-70 factor (ECF subfamily)
MLSLSEREIIIKIKNGEIEHFSFLVRKYMKIIYNYISKKIYNRLDIDDLVQNSFLSFYKSIKKFNEEKPPLPYLYTIAKNEIKMYLRVRKVILPLNERILASDESDNQFFQEDVSRLAEKLAEDQKKALKLLSEGYNYQEIAQKFKKPVNTVKSIIRRARLKISKKYGKT